MSRNLTATSLGYDIAPSPAPLPLAAPFSVNLPPQYARQAEIASQYPDQTDIRLPFQSISDDQAVKIVKQDYETAANYRYQNHDWRWVIADTLFTGWKQTRFWEGTRIPRANVSVMTDFDQIESFMPKVMSAIFSDPDWFETVGRGRTSPKAARKIRDIVLTQLGDCNPREVVRRTMKSGVMYGNGILMVGWDYRARKRLAFTPEFVPRMRPVRSPIDNTISMLPSGQFDRRVVERVIEDYINSPIIRYIPLKRCFVDPNAPSPVPSESRFFIYESYMYVDQLDAMRDSPGFESMPDLHTLYLMAKQNSYTQADMTQSEQEAARRASWMPWVDQSADPAAARVKIIHYFTNDRVIWSINNRFVAYNKPNDIGRITFHDAFYSDLLDRFYAMAISDVVEPEQRVQEGLLNSRLDELSLAIHPTTVKQRGSGTPIYQIRVRPGGVAESSDPKNDVIRQYPQNATANAHLEAQASQMRVQMHTGVTDIGNIGIGSPTNPAARTATGAGLQGQASASRMVYIVENCESTLIEPLLKDVFDYNQLFLDPNQMIEGAYGSDLDPMEIFGATVKFEMRASAKMQSKQALVQLMPMTLQAMLNPQLINQLHSIGKTVDFVEMMQMFMDASGYRDKFNWIRDLTPEEVKMLQKPDPSQVEMMLQQQRMSSMANMQTAKSEMDILKTIIQSVLDAQTAKEEAKMKTQTEAGAE